MKMVTLTVDGQTETIVVEDRTTLVDGLRDHIGCTSVNVGCEQGICGACTVLLDEVPVRSCLMLAVQAEGRQVTTVAGLRTLDPERGPILQESFREAHGLQCGFCTPGMLLTARSLLCQTAEPDDDTIRDALHGNLCRCTGYEQIIESVQLAAERLADGAGAHRHGD